MHHRNHLGRIYCWTAQIGKAENAQTLDRICLGCKPSKSKRSYRKQQDTRKWTMRAGRADTVQAQEEHAKKQQHTQNKYRITLTTSSAKATLGGNRTCTKGQPEYALEYVSPLGKNSSATRIRMASSGTLLNTAGRVWTLLNNIEQGWTLRTFRMQLNTHGHCWTQLGTTRQRNTAGRC